eukprot:COSAG06_NODE_25251_length_641_cov_1.241697_1_plen_75_part_10
MPATASPDLGRDGDGCHSVGWLRAGWGRDAELGVGTADTAADLVARCVRAVRSKLSKDASAMRMKVLTDADKMVN